MERQQKVAEIFAAVLEKEPESQIAFLKNECGDDEALFVEVRELLDSFNRAQANDFMSASALENEAESLIADEETDARIGQIVGHYKILEKIGVGGMGAIYLAERSDAEIEKRAAVKIIKRGMDTDAILQRFRNERQILANLEHPNIARLIDAGTTNDSLPFFVMEFVDGIPINEYCQTNNLSENERLELFRKVGSAVSFAHQKLIIHRDLKPSNILVTKDGEPKLLDFGIAKLLNSDKAGETKTEMRVLTPAYASPEQKRGEIVETNSDVYSLGIVLAEMMGFEDLRFKIQDSSKNSNSESKIKNQKSNFKFQKLNRDLQNILAKSLREDAARRYQSVEQFSEDIRRYLAGLPVTARKDSRFYRASKFVQRNKTASTIAVLFVLSLIGGLIATLWQFRHAQTERARAERRFNDVRGLVNTFLAELNDEMWKVPGTTKARQLLVQRTLEYLDNASREAGGDATLQRELITAYVKVGDIQGNSYYQNLGDTSGALISYQKALEIGEQLAKENPANAEIENQLAHTYESMGDILWDRGDLNAAIENYSRATKTMEDLSAAAPDDEETKLYLAQLYTDLADVRYVEGRRTTRDIPGSLTEHDKALKIREPLASAHPEERKFNTYLYQSYARLAVIHRLEGDFAGELYFLQKAEAITDKWLARDPQNPNRRRDSSISAARFATYYIDAGDFKKAQEYIQKSLILRELMISADKADTRSQTDLANSYDSEGRLLMESGNGRGALDSYRKQLKICEDLVAIDASNRDWQKDLVNALINVGRAYLATSDSNAALAAFNRALDLARNFPVDDLQIQGNMASIYEGAGLALWKQAKLAEADDNFQKAIELREADVQSDKQNVITRAELAKLYYEAGKACEQEDKQTARTLYQKSLNSWNALREQNAVRKIDEKKFEEVNKALNKI